MNRPQAPVPPPWGHHAPRGLLARVLRRSTSLPPTPQGGRLGRILRTLARAGRPSRPVDVELWGLRLRLHTRGNVSEARILFMPTLWEPRERALLAERARPGFIFVDVGANAGGYSFWVLGLLGSACRILAVEPDPELNERLRFNARANGADTLEVIQVAVSDREGEGVLHFGRGNRGENRLVVPEGAGAGPGGGNEPGATTTVPLRSLHAIVAEAGLPRIDALKIDIEGMELRVLNAFFQTAPAHLRPRLLITEHHGTPDHEELQGLLAGVGYRVVLATGLNRVLELDGGPGPLSGAPNPIQTAPHAP